jgi:tetratricopeptide (TPR) repeat protein
MPQKPNKAGANKTQNRKGRIAPRHEETQPTEKKADFEKPTDKKEETVEPDPETMVPETPIGKVIETVGIAPETAKKMAAINRTFPAELEEIQMERFESVRKGLFQAAKKRYEEAIDRLEQATGAKLSMSENASTLNGRIAQIRAAVDKLEKTREDNIEVIKNSSVEPSEDEAATMEEVTEAIEALRDSLKTMEEVEEGERLFREESLRMDVENRERLRKVDRGIKALSNIDKGWDGSEGIVDGGKMAKESMRKAEEEEGKAKE